MAKKSKYKSKNNIKGLLPFLLLFAIVGVLTVIISFAQPSRGGNNSSDPWATTDKLHVDPVRPVVGQQLNITYDKLVSPKGGFKSAYDVMWDIQCYQDGDTSGSNHASAYNSVEDVRNVSGKYSTALRANEHTVPGETLTCFLSFTTRTNSNIYWDRIRFQATVAP